MVSKLTDLGERVCCRIKQVSDECPGSIADMLNFQLVSCGQRDVVFTCRTQPWMRNASGTLHGGLCTTILDQAMGFVCHCLIPGEGSVPTVHLEVNYHRPLDPGEQVVVKVHVLSVTRSLITLNAEAFQATNPEKISLSGSGTHFIIQKK